MCIFITTLVIFAGQQIENRNHLLLVYYSKYDCEYKEFKSDTVAGLTTHAKVNLYTIMYQPQVPAQQRVAWSGFVLRLHII